MSRPEFVYISYIETTPEKLWEALTSSEFTKRYWFDTEVRSDWKVGSPVALVMNGKITDTGVILEADPPRRLSYTFKHELIEEMRSEPVTKVVFTIEAYGDLVKLTVTHEGFESPDSQLQMGFSEPSRRDSRLLDSISEGWPAILSSLKSLLETGKTLAIPPAALRI